MRRHGIVGRAQARRVRTTIPAEDAPPLPDLIGRRFDPGPPDVAWVGDITYVPTGEGWLYLASVLDLGSRRLLGYSMADHMRTELVADALRMAAGARGGDVAGVIFHGDRGQPIPRRRLPPAPRRPRHGPVRRPDRGLLGQRGRRIVLVLAETRAACTATGSRAGPTPAGRSSPGSTATTTSGSTPASATSHPPNGRTATVNPRPTRPHNPRDRPTGRRSAGRREACVCYHKAWLGMSIG